ncbi:MAG: hypothetical protein ACLFWD_06580 [Anaerolineales bacterium]
MMKFISKRNLAIGLSFAALLTEMWRGMLDAMFVFSVDFSDPATMELAAIIYALLFGGWGLALAFAWRGSRRAMISNLAINLLIVLAIPVGWLFFYCTAECRAEAGIFNLANTLNLILGLLAALTAGLHLWAPSPEPRTGGESEGAYDAG